MDKTQRAASRPAICRPVQLLRGAVLPREGKLVLIIDENQGIEQVLTRVRERAQNLFHTRQLSCSEAVLSVLNQGLGGGLAPEMAIRLSSGLTEGLGGSGCMCGALNAGVLALGLFLGRNGPGLCNARRVMSAARRLQQQFSETFGATCCRVLTRKIKRGSQGHFDECSHRTGMTAQMTARILIEERPALRHQIDWHYLKHQDSRTGANFKKFLKLIG